MEDVISLPSFRCNICSCRLQSPVLKVGNFGNICVSCYERSAYTDVTENSEIEMILSKLDVPCNFAELGCTYKGPYYKTCGHEKVCRFRKRLCPFSYLLECAYQFVKSEDVVHHIRKHHEKKVIKVENDHCNAENPTAHDPDVMYLLQLDRIWILVRAKLKIEKELIYYAFYHFGDLQGRLINIRSTAFENSKRNNRVTHESKITLKFDKSNAFQAKMLTLKHLGYYKKIKISLALDKSTIRSSCEEVPAKNDFWSRCRKCSKYVNALWFCPNCYSRECEQCKEQLDKAEPLYCYEQSCRKYSCFYFNLADAGITRQVRCENDGCNQIIRGNADVYRVHRDYQCPIKVHQCIVENCRFKDSTYKFIEHTFTKHQRENTNKFSIKSSTSHTRLFSNGDDIFLHKYFLNDEKELQLECVKLTEPFWDDACVWIVNVICKSGQPVTVRGDYTLKGFTRKMAVGEYIEKDSLLLEIHIKRI